MDGPAIASGRPATQAGIASRGDTAKKAAIGLYAPEKGRRSGTLTRSRRLPENSILSQGTTLRAAEKLCFVSGHDFSRAVNDREKVRALAPAVVASPKFSGN